MSPANLKPVSLARKLLSFNTINPPGHERECAQYLGHLLAGAGLQTQFFEFAEKRTTLIARLEGSGHKPPICFTGHLDTVPLGAAPWNRDPFGGDLDGDRLYGRGSSDMKGGVAAMVVMALRLAKMKNRKAGITFVFTAGEETCCEGAQHVAGLDNVLGRAGAMIVGEPTSNAPWVAHKGSVRFAIKTRGVTAHASMPERGDNAIHKAAEAIMKLRHLDFGVAPHPLLGGPTLNIGTISGGKNINSVPDEATIGIDIRTIPGQHEEVIRQKLQAGLGGEVEIERLGDARSVETDSQHEWVREVFDVMERLLKQRPRPAGAPYFTDASALKPACGDPPTVILGPGEPEMAHRTDELCYVSKLDAAVEAYVEIAKRWCGV